METNQFFSLKRFYLLIKNDLLINYKTYLFTLMGAFIAGFVIFYISMPKSFPASAFDNDNYMQIAVICLFGLGVFVGLSFPELSNKIKTTNYLLLPASTFEKFLVQFSLRFIGGSLLFTVIIWLDAHLARWIILNVFEGFDSTIIEKVNIHAMFKGAKFYSILPFIFAILSIGTYLFSIRLFFRKNALVKTVISLGFVVYIMFCLMVLFSHLFYPQTTGFNVTLNEYELTFLPIRNVELWFHSIMYLSGLFLLPLGYFKLKEKQV